MSVSMTSVVRFAALERWDPPAEVAHAGYAWPVALLSEVAGVRLGVQVPRRGTTLHGVARPYLRAANVRRGRIDLTDVKTMHVSAGQAAALELQAGDLLFVEGSGSVTEVGRAAAWHGSIPQVIHQNSVIRARLHDERLDPAYVVTWFNSQAGNGYIREQATTTSGLYHIGAGKLSGAPIPIPPLDVQQQIVAAYAEGLERASIAAQAATELAAAAWGSFANQLITDPQEVTRRATVAVVRFASLLRWDTEAQPSALTASHRIVRLGDVADVRLGTQVPSRQSRPSGTPVAYLRAANVQRGHLALDDVKTMVVPQSTIDRLRLNSDDILFVEGNSLEEVGRAAVWPPGLGETIIQNSIVRARLTTDQLDPHFVAAWFNSPPGGRYVRERATTTSGSLWHIGAGKLAGAPMPLPPLAEQQRLVAQLRDGLAAAGRAVAEAEHLQDGAELELRAALLNG